LVCSAVPVPPPLYAFWFSRFHAFRHPSAHPFLYVFGTRGLQFAAKPRRLIVLRIPSGLTSPSSPILCISCIFDFETARIRCLVLILWTTIHPSIDRNAGPLRGSLLRFGFGFGHLVDLYRALGRAGSRLFSFVFTRSSMVILCTRAPCLCHLESSCLHHTLDSRPLTSVSISCICFCFICFRLLYLPLSACTPQSSTTDLNPQCTFSIFSATIGNRNRLSPPPFYAFDCKNFRNRKMVFGLSLWTTPSFSSDSRDLISLTHPSILFPQRRLNSETTLKTSPHPAQR